MKVEGRGSEVGNHLRCLDDAVLRAWRLCGAIGNGRLLALRRTELGHLSELRELSERRSFGLLGRPLDGHTLAKVLEGRKLRVGGVF